MDPIFFFRLAIVVLFVAMLGEASLNKILARQTPAWFVDQFAATWMGKLPIAPMYWFIALSELTIALVFIGAAVTGELTGSEVGLLSLGCFGASLLFSALLFGQRVAGDYPGSFSAFVYSALSLLLLVALQATAGV